MNFPKRVFLYLSLSPSPFSLFPFLSLSLSLSFPISFFLFSLSISLSLSFSLSLSLCLSPLLPLFLSTLKPPPSAYIVTKLNLCYSFTVRAHYNAARNLPPERMAEKRTGQPISGQPASKPGQPLHALRPGSTSRVTDETNHASTPRSLLLGEIVGEFIIPG